MNFETNYYVFKIKEELTQRQRVNAGYSMRAYARDLKMHPATLSMVLHGRRPLPEKNKDFVLQQLELSPGEESIFIDSLARKKASLRDIEISKEYDNRYVVDDSNYSVIAEWEHYAILTLIETKNFDHSPQAIGNRLGISVNRVEVVLKNLEIAQLIGQNEHGTFVLLKSALRTTEDIFSKALRVSHKETLEMGKAKIDDVEIELRDFSSMTIAIDPKNLSEAKAIIREFRKKIASLLRDGEKTEVYQLAIQLYPLTKKKERT